MSQQSGRTIRTKKKTATKKSRSKSKAPEPRSVTILVEMLQRKELEAEELADTLTDAEVVLLVERGGHLNDQIKTAEKELKPLKELLKSYARKTKTVDMSTSSIKCTMSPSTSTETGTPMDLIKLLKDEKKTNLVNDLLSVKLTECKKYLGEKFLEAKGFIVKKSDKFGKINLKRR